MSDDSYRTAHEAAVSFAEALDRSIRRQIGAAAEMTRLEKERRGLVPLTYRPVEQVSECLGVVYTDPARASRFAGESADPLTLLFDVQYPE